MSFSFCFSHNDSNDNQLDSSNKSHLFEIPCDSLGELHNLSSISPSAAMQDVPFVASSSSSSLSPSNGALLVHSGIGHFIFVPSEDSDEEDSDEEGSDSVQEVEASESLSSAGSLSHYVNNFALAEAQFKSLLNLNDEPSMSNTTDSHNGSNSSSDHGLEQDDDGSSHYHC
jgi:hypothetical protein